VIPDTLSVKTLPEENGRGDAGWQGSPPPLPLALRVHSEPRRALGSIAINGPAFCFEFPGRGGAGGYPVGVISEIAVVLSLLRPFSFLSPFRFFDGCRCRRASSRR